MHRQRAQDYFGKLDKVRFPPHLNPGLTESFSYQSVTVETEGQYCVGVEHPSEHVVFLKEAAMLLEEFLCDRAQQHGFRTAAEETYRLLPRLRLQPREPSCLAPRSS